MRADVRAAWEAARRAHGDLGLTPEELAEEARRGLRRRREAAALPADDDVLDALLPSLALGDLYLARACERGSEAAWRALHAAYAPRLAGLLRKREGRAIDAESWVDELFGELALPPAAGGAGGARTRLGGYDASGSLLGWLAATLLHRLERRGRDRLRPAGDLAERLAPPAPPPLAPLLDREDAVGFERAFGEGWSRLEREERAAIVWKHRHGWSQRAIARALDVGEERVSRWVQRGLAKLRGALASRGVEDVGAPRSARSEALLAALERRLATSALETAPPPSGEDAP